MTEAELQRVPPGLYRVWWDEGGSSEAAIGMNQDGTRWLAPINWASPVTAVDPFEIIRVERILPAQEVSEAPPSAAELRDAILEHPKIADDLRELLLVRDHPAPGHLIIDRTDDDNIYYIERHAARGQVKAHEVEARNKDFGCNSLFFEAEKLVQTPRGGPHGPVIWELRA